MSRPCACIYCRDACQVPDDVPDAICPACRAARDRLAPEERNTNRPPNDPGACHQ